MDKKIINSNPFCPNGAVFEGEKDFDQFYENISILDRVVKTGEGENDFIVEKYVKVDKTPIQEVIDADASEVGVYNIIRKVMQTGDTSLLPIDKGDCNVDMVGAPETLMEVKTLGQEAENAFKQLDPSITEGRDMKSFVDNMSQEKFDALIKAIADRSSGKEKQENE